MTISNPHPSAQIIKERIGDLQPRMAIVLGSGLKALADEIENPIIIPYSDLPGFPSVHVKGHGNRLLIGTLAGLPIACLHGRDHAYESQSYEGVKTYVRALKLIGCEIFLATNASGSLRKEITPGSLVLIKDHINCHPGNPLTGLNDDEFGPRFLPMNDVYNASIRAKLLNCAKELGIGLREGIYLSVLGPMYETAAEVKMFQILGAEVIGMSTIPEVIVAHHCGMKIVAIATATNYATGVSNETHDHDLVVKNAAKAGPKLVRLVKRFAEMLDAE